MSESKPRGDDRSALTGRVELPEGPRVGVVDGPVRVLLGNRGDLARGRVDVGSSMTPPWGAFETIWIACARL
jgi:hypothetical protein